MTDALIGYTGFVGGTLARQRSFDNCYNTKNIENIVSRHYDLIVCAGAPAAKWLVNDNPDQDWENLLRLQDCLADCTANRIVLVSTVDVYNCATDVDETASVDFDANHAYGRHRYLLEKFVTNTFPQVHVVRLPALFGDGLKKNFIFDMLNHKCLNWTHRDSQFQFYDMSRLWSDCEVVINAGLPLVNLAPEPVTAVDVARECFHVEFKNVTDKPPAKYDVQTRYGAFFGKPDERYLATRSECLEAISNFVTTMRSLVA